MCRANRSGNTMIVSSASEPQISVRAAPRPLTRPALPAVLTGIFAANLAHDELLTPRDRQGLSDAAQEDLPMRVTFGTDVPLETANRLPRNEAVAMHADEARPELLLQLGKRFLEQVLALGRADGDVLELRLEVDDLFDWNEDDPRALGDRQEAPRGRWQLVQLRTGKRLEPRYLLQRGQQSLHPYGLHQVIDRVHLEGRDRMLVISRCENQHRRHRELEQVPGQLDAVHIRHVDVGEHEVSGRAAEQTERLAPARRLADDH